jgi:UDP-N-acetylglucosamine 2-epimerase (non-hydrolysing)
LELDTTQATTAATAATGVEQGRRTTTTTTPLVGGRAHGPQLPLLLGAGGDGRAQPRAPRTRRLSVLTMVGTRPEVIKMAPVVRELERHGEDFESTIATSGQHREMLDQALAAFSLAPKVDLALMQPNQGIAEFLCRSLSAMTVLLRDVRPDVVLIQGDTTTVLTTAMAAFQQGVRVAHIEAGLRSFNRLDPYPEEMNRRLVAALADLHFAPTQRARQNLLREGIADHRIFVTGNTIVDALRQTPHDGPFEDGRIDEALSGADGAAEGMPAGARTVLVTAHRRENHGPRLYAICGALRTLVRRFRDVRVIFPVHLNPNVDRVVRRELGGVPRVHLVEPVSYGDLLRLMARCFLILSDSGGIQEEAPSMHKPVLILRDVTERPEVVECGAGKLVGTSEERIVAEVTRLLVDEDEYAAMSGAGNPFGDGRAAERIVEVLKREL